MRKKKKTKYIIAEFKNLQEDKLNKQKEQEDASTSSENVIPMPIQPQSGLQIQEKNVIPEPQQPQSGSQTKKKNAIREEFLNCGIIAVSEGPKLDSWIDFEFIDYRIDDDECCVKIHGTEKDVINCIFTNEINGKEIFDFSDSEEDE